MEAAQGPLPRWGVAVNEFIDKPQRLTSRISSMRSWVDFLRGGARAAGGFRGDWGLAAEGDGSDEEEAMF